jgi:tetratricopeptide (TPR) repeat protein
LFSIGALALLQDDAQRAYAWLAESVQLMRATEDPRLAYAPTPLGWSLTDLGQPTEARILYRESTAVAEARGDRWSIALKLAIDATALARLGDRPAGTRRLQTSLELFAELGDRWGCAVARRGLAGFAALDGQYTLARSLYLDSARVLREVGDQRGLAQTLLSYARAAYKDGDTAAAQMIYGQALECWQRIGIIGGSLRALRGLAVTLAAQTRFDEAAWIFAVARANSRESPDVLRSDSAETERWIAESRAGLGDAAFGAAWASGFALPLDLAIPTALSQVPALLSEAT